MNTDIGESLHYCAETVRRFDEDRWLAAQYAPPPIRGRLLALYALHVEIERAPAMVSEAPLGEIRLQWWREAVEELALERKPRAHPVLEAARAVKVIDAATRAAFDAAIDARARLLYAELFEDVGELEQWLRASDGYLAIAAARATGALSPVLEPALTDAGAAFALARDGARRAPDIEENICGRAKELAETSAMALRALPAAILPAALHFALTKSYLKSRGALSPLVKRWRLFASMASGRL